MRRFATLFTCMLACACARTDGRVAMPDSRVPPALSPRFFPPPGWAFGLIRAGKAPAQRYGVSAPVGGVSRGTLLILTDYGESAEAWYETIRALNDQGWTVWVLERLGQGGSERYSSQRDLGHAISLDPDIDAVSGLISRVIRPSRGVVVLGQGEGGLIGLRAAASGAPVVGLVLSSPAMTSPPETATQTRLRFLGLGGLRVDRASAWRRDGPDAQARGLTHDWRRGRVEMAWQQVNPDLRMGGPSLSRAAAVRTAQRDLSADAITTPTLILENGNAGADFCRRLAQCEHRVLDGGTAYYLEADPWRESWLQAVERFAKDRTAADKP